MKKQTKSASSEKILISAIKQTLDNSEHELDKGTLNKLQQARTTAVQHSVRPGTNRSYFNPWLRPVTGAAVIALCVGLLFSVWHSGSTDYTEISSIEDLQILSEAEDFKLYEELEFYQWLADEEDIG